MAAYKKMVKYKSAGALLTFLGIKDVAHSKTTFKIFFEVTLGNRIADSVLLTQYGDTRNIYIIEFKTCSSDRVDVYSEIRRSQRLQGLQQLADSIKYIGTNIPSGRTPWLIHPYLIFKSQKTLKTIHCERPNFTINLIHTNTDRLLTYFSALEDVNFKRTKLTVTKPQQSSKHYILGTKPKQYINSSSNSCQSTENNCAPLQGIHRKRKCHNNKKKTYCLGIRSSSKNSFCKGAGNIRRPKTCNRISTSTNCSTASH